ncbi:uncharacterized protein MONBRDRAFT_5319 [Monosiga brevicollis MX1]|uniref:Pre-mRNA-splicing factor 38 n=1 Tax=Monosiga brevicollis TaxID=81824 RepID=A9UQL8_MONBE|nr:uncharacterized protein MONBRDRAFT_5319 [Monosiga brevicollis MX1]EDQ93067.1 predicted protein [Monosiga brevicollis MX1]|eukprot:XP_001742829.1 hypothetical protein [Monosiga brevicollis MX1]
MANKTVGDAGTVHGANPQFLVEKIIRTRIYDTLYWKEHCFALTAETVIDKAVQLDHIGGVYGGSIKPTPFLCLTLKLLQLAPDKDIIYAYIAAKDFKYLQALGVFYLRLVGTAKECYSYLEPFLEDFRKLRHMKRDGQYELMHMDEFVDQLLREDRVCDIILPRLMVRMQPTFFSDVLL